jgi:hypothetical protein
VIAVFLGGIWLYGHNYAKNKADATIAELNRRIAELESTPVVVDPVTPEIVQKVISENMLEVAELATAEYIFTNAARFSDTAHIIVLLDWMTEKSFVQMWDGRITAGVNLEEMEVSVEGKTITISLPYAEILTYEIDYDSVKILNEKNNIFNPISVNDKVNFDIETRKNMEERAIKNGLLNRALENAKRTIANIVTVSIEEIQDYEIKFLIVNR